MASATSSTDVAAARTPIDGCSSVIATRKTGIQGTSNSASIADPDTYVDSPQRDRGEFGDQAAMAKSATGPASNR
jgi:hypothetical protein